MREDIDIAIRVGVVRGRGLVAVPPGTSRCHVCAAPARLLRHGTPSAPRRNCLAFTLPEHYDVLPFSRAGEQANILIACNVTRNGSEAIPGKGAVRPGDLAITGQIPARLLAWLSHRARVPEIILFPDYDGVGLQNYVRLRDQVTLARRFWMMPDWRARLRRYGSNEVWRNTHAEFMSATARLVAANTPTELLALCAAIRREGLALEHEAVWLDRPVE